MDSNDVLVVGGGARRAGDRGRAQSKRHRGHRRAPGMYFIGFTNPISGMFREFGIDARKIARAIARERGAAPSPVPAGRPDAVAA